MQSNSGNINLISSNGAFNIINTKQQMGLQQQPQQMGLQQPQQQMGLQMYRPATQGKVGGQMLPFPQHPTSGQQPVGFKYQSVGSNSGGHYAMPIG